MLSSFSPQGLGVGRCAIKVYYFNNGLPSVQNMICDRVFFYQNLTLVDSKIRVAKGTRESAIQAFYILPNG